MAPPNSPSDVEDWLRLALAPRIGPAHAHRLLASFGSLQGVLEAPSPEMAKAMGVREEAIRSLHCLEAKESARREYEQAIELGLELLALDSPGYPRALKDLSNPPLVLYVRGRLQSGDRLALTVVGPRSPSDYARTMTRTLIAPLSARAITIVSGLAMGIDAEAHGAALAAEGRTIAVMAHGLDLSVQPSSSRGLAERIVREDRGALVSAFALGTRAHAGNFPIRNELVAAFGLGSLIIEASEKSGALITARHAADLGRTVMACPGDATRLGSRGSNRLLADGATLIQRSDDVLEALAGELRRAREELDAPDAAPRSDAAAGAIEPAAQPSSPTHALDPSDPLERCIADMLCSDHRSIDFLLEGCAAAGHSHSAVVQKLLYLEMRGAIGQLPGRVYSLALR